MHIFHDFKINLPTTDNINLFLFENINNNYNLKEKEEENKMILVSNSTKLTRITMNFPY